MSDPHVLGDSSRGPRLQKVLAAAGVGSRRACEALIESGAVAVNGRTVTRLPAWVDPGADRVTVHGARLRPASRHVYVMLFKPKRVVCTNADPSGRRRAIDLVDHPSQARLFAVGRLDTDSSGLLLLTNDGELANRLTHPRYHLPKVYRVTVKGALEDDALRAIEKGLYLGDRKRTGGARTGRSRVRLVKRDRDRTQLEIELREGRNRQIRRLMAQLGHPVKGLRRMSVGPLVLRGLRVGEWRPLTPRELAALKKAAFGR